ncbi:SHOCT domain-containing protein [Chthonobacter rhizosphaerae]|uniref:SHOCT domain-containing protein n=1 Tax=Chthonobacter rhizosphaerae TaxID=2735553 RepID=UPI0015EFB83F|nr:SHOCT domain-containing protein [Chthonobacter rhizosphaerae]
MSTPLSASGEQLLTEIAGRHGFSPDAAHVLLAALLHGGGRMAQFAHPELGGMGQWSQGGMIMIGDMFNNALKARVSAFADDLSAAIATGSVAAERKAAAGGGFGGAWWPDGLGSPSSAGGQNSSRYAVFPATRRLAVEENGTVSVYDTGDHQIGGVSQQQGSGADLTFQSQYGTVRARDLKRVSPDDARAARADTAGRPETAGMPETVAPPMDGRPATETPALSAGPGHDQPAAPQPSHRPTEPTSGDAARSGGRESPGDIVSALERLAGLKEKGLLSDDEFATSKRELLARL